MKSLLLLLALTLPLSAGPLKLLKRASQVALTACAAADASSSLRKPEANPLLRSRDGSFGRKGVAIKAGAFGGYLAAQEIDGGHDKRYTGINFGLAAANCWAAGRNRKK